MSKERVVESENPYHRNFRYEESSVLWERNRLLSYLEGKPDTSDWREEFAERRSGPLTLVAYKGKIYPRWAVEDYYELMDRQPEIFDGCEVPEVPPRELVEGGF